MCGFPTANGDLYGGALYLQSASIGPQASALLAASSRWGSGAAGKEQIPVPVCKRKYQPFQHKKHCRMVADRGGGSSSSNRVCENSSNSSGGGGGGDSNRREQMYGCHLHHARRKALIERGGLREGWEDFDQWLHQQQQRSSTSSNNNSPICARNSPARASPAVSAAAAGKVASSEEISSSVLGAGNGVGDGEVVVEATEGGDPGRRNNNVGQGRRKRPRLPQASEAEPGLASGERVGDHDGDDVDLAIPVQRG